MLLGLNGQGVVSGTVNTAFGDILSAVRDVAGVWVKDRADKRSYQAASLATPPQQVVYQDGYGANNKSHRARGTGKPLNYQAWGIALAVVGIVVSIYAVVKE